jgi:DNA-binding MarR family transcriptional regulator
MRSGVGRITAAECARCAELLHQSVARRREAEERRGAVVYRGLVTGPEGEREWEQVRDDSILQAHSPAELARQFGPFSSPERIALLLALYRSDCNAQALCDESGLTQGQLYHHIKELIYVGYVQQQGRSRYRITEKGSQALLTLAVLAEDFAQHP